MQKKLRAAALVSLSVATLWFGTSASARILQPGESLQTGSVMHSEDGRYLAVMQADGNFVVYRNDGSSRAIWSTNTTGRGAVLAVMQHDGNFVLYDGAGRAVWWTASNGRDRTFTISEYGQAMVVAPGKVPSRTKGPGSRLWKQLHVKPVWVAREYDFTSAPRRDGPHCVGDPRACGKQLHGPLHRGP
jgi:hypothetical protein